MRPLTASQSLFGALSVLPPALPAADRLSSPDFGPRLKPRHPPLVSPNLNARVDLIDSKILSRNVASTISQSVHTQHTTNLQTRAESHSTGEVAHLRNISSLAPSRRTFGNLTLPTTKERPPTLPTDELRSRSPVSPVPDYFAFYQKYQASRCSLIPILDSTHPLKARKRCPLLGYPHQPTTRWISARASRHPLVPSKT